MYPRIATCPLTGIKAIVRSPAEEAEFIYGPALAVFRFARWLRSCFSTKGERQ